MSTREVKTAQTWVKEFSDAAKGSVHGGAAKFKEYVGSLGGRFDLAVLNVGDVLFNRVLGCERALTEEERNRHPNVQEAIAIARAELQPQPCTPCH